jgi:S1-C subfamily serine protease
MLKLRIMRIFLVVVLLSFLLLLVVGFTNNGPMEASATVSPSPTNTSSTGQTVNEQLAHIEQELNDLKQQPKDLWGKISSISPLISGVLVAMIGAIATYVYNKRQRTAQEQDLSRQISADETRSQRDIRIKQAQTIEAFLPHLASRDAREKEAALVALSALGLEDPNLVVKLAAMYKDEGGQAALTRLATSPDETVAAAARSSVIAFYDLLKSSVTQILKRGRPFGSGFAIANGRLIVTTDFIANDFVTRPETDRSGVVDVLTADGRSLQATVQSIHPEYGLAFLQLKDESLTPMDLSSREDLEPLATVILLMSGRYGWLSRSGSVEGVSHLSYGQENEMTEPHIVIRPAADQGGAGGPVVDGTGKVVAVIGAVDMERDLTYAIPSNLIIRAIPAESTSTTTGEQ